jgi:hypothetical protein
MRVLPQRCQTIALRPTAERSTNPMQSIVGFSEITPAKCAETVGANATGLHWQRRDALLRDLNIGDNGKMFGPWVGPGTGRKGTIANLRQAAQNGRLLSAQLSPQCTRFNVCVFAANVRNATSQQK